VDTSVADAAAVAGSGGGVESGVGPAVGAGVEVSWDSALGISGDATSAARMSTDGVGVASIEEVAGVLDLPQARASEVSTATRARRSAGCAGPPRTELKAYRERRCAPC
jgi:hypothetical protein